MTKHLITLKGPDGEVWLKPENPYHSMLPNSGIRDGRYTHFEETNPPYPLHNYTLSPGDRVEADGFELVWQKECYAEKVGETKWITCTYAEAKLHEVLMEESGDDLGIRQVYIPVASKEGEKEESKPDLTIDDFYPGFEYQMKATFSDGTVKTQQDYDQADWLDCTYTEGDRPYIERMLNGRNAQNGLLGLRRKP